jgi:hypothetical protein
MADPDVAIVEPRRVKCGLCERWIKGSNTQEYSSHHWLKHKRKCARLRADVTDGSSEPAEARKAQLEADPTVNILEPHRALCNICNKVKCFIVLRVPVYTELLICTASGLNCVPEAGTQLAIGCNISESVSHKPRVGRPRRR